MAYIKHTKEFWDKEAEWIVNEFAKPSGARIGMFMGYCDMQLNCCDDNGTSPEAANKIRNVCKALRAGQ